MKDIIIQDERVLCANDVKKAFAAFRKNRLNAKYKQALFLSDGSFICDCLFNAVTEANKKKPLFSRINYADTNISEFSVEGNAIFFFADCVGGLDSKQVTVKKLKEILEFMSKSKNTRMVITVLLPQIECFSSEITSLAEREFNFYIEKKAQITPEIEYYLEIEKICREAVRDNSLDITLLRYDNVFSSDYQHTPSFDLKNIIKECFDNKKVNITDDDCVQKSTITYISTACYQILYAFFKGKAGHVYNGAEVSVSVDDIKQAIYETNTDLFSISRNISAGITHKYNALNNLKLKRLYPQRSSQFALGIKHVVCYITETEYDTSDSVSFYAGRIKNIQALETKILMEIDRICRKHNIKYFLAGGSLLGAVREKGAIEWDDDLDIGMLREDLEKFRKVCESELSDKFYLSGALNNSGSHYTLDKVRLNGTYFSTRFSSHSVFKDGVFCDVLVYDKTSNNKILRRLHRFVLAAFTKTNEIKWYGEPRRKFYYKFSVLMLPLLKIIPWKPWHRIFEFFATIFKNQKNTEWLIDSAGKKVNDDPLLNKGFHDTVYVDYEGIKAPIPIDSYPYLNWVYGESYMQKPALSQRRCPHNFGRIDLGKYVFDVDETKKYRDIDIRGELFESEEEI